MRPKPASSISPVVGSGTGAAIDHAKALGMSMATAEVDALVVPSDLLAALAALAALVARPPAQAHFEAFAPSYRRNVLRWIDAAKQDATRSGRIERTATLAALGQKVPQL
jgi:uncharacterized protein YdeI (YjbR/CyaY-like superfamily)